MTLKRTSKKGKLFIFLFLCLYYPPDSQERVEGAIHRASNYPDLLPEMPRYLCPNKILFWFFSFINI